MLTRNQLHPPGKYSHYEGPWTFSAISRGEGGLVHCPACRKELPLQESILYALRILPLKRITVTFALTSGSQSEDKDGKACPYAMAIFAVLVTLRYGKALPYT